MTDERITPSFWLSEFLGSETAQRRGIDNTPPPQELANLRTILAPGMQRIREALGAPISISSGYRSPALNKAIRGAASSQHTQGLAADFTAPSFGRPLAICRRIVELREAINFDQLIFEGTWVHVSFAPKPRGQVLTAKFGALGTTYAPGLPVA